MTYIPSGYESRMGRPAAMNDNVYIDRALDREGIQQYIRWYLSGECRMESEPFRVGIFVLDAVSFNSSGKRKNKSAFGLI
jgi:hypothetical protein